MIRFNFFDFLLDNRISTADLARQIHVKYRCLQLMVTRGTIKPSFLKKLEVLYAMAPEYVESESIPA